MKKEKQEERKKNFLKVILSSVLFFNIAYYVPHIALAGAETPKVAVDETLPVNPQDTPGDNPTTPQKEVLLPEKVVPSHKKTSPDCHTVKGKTTCDHKKTSN